MRNTAYTMAGTIMLVLGAIGVFLPVLPTTPFVLGAALCYTKGNPRLYKWIVNARFFGPIIRNYEEGTGVPIRTRIIAIASLWAMMLLSIFLLKNPALTILLISIGVCVTIHIIRMNGRVELPDDDEIPIIGNCPGENAPERLVDKSDS